MGKRSSGCITCRKRKVKCDENKPTCERCAKATYKCAGYDQRWLDEAPYIRIALERTAAREARYSERWNAMLPSEAITAAGYLPVEALASPIHLSAFREDICRSFLFHKLCAGQNFSKAMSWWLNARPNAEVQSRTLVSASKAMCAAYFGQVHRQQSIITEGTRFYGEALVNLCADLSHAEKAYAFETLGATMALNMYELVNMNSNTRGWITHAGGVAELIQARGPALHKTYPEKEFYLESRMLLVANGVFTCRRTFLDGQIWKDVPWEDDSPAKTPFDYLVDVLSDIPFFLELITNLHDSSTAAGNLDLPDKDLLKKQLLDAMRTLKELRVIWHTKYSTPLWSVPVTPPASPHPLEGTHNMGPHNVAPPFQTVLYFQNMVRAYEYCIYQMTSLLIYQLYQDISGGDTQPLRHILPLLLPQNAVQSLAHEICRSTEYLCLDKHGSRGYMVLQFPAIVAYHAVNKESAEAKWLYDVCKRNARENGYGFGDFALDQVTPLSIWLASCRERYGIPVSDQLADESHQTCPAGSSALPVSSEGNSESQAAERVLRQ